MTPSKGILHAALCTAIFVASWVGTALLIGRQLPLPNVDAVSDKIDWLKKNGEKYDTLFLGSSRTNRHIQADFFDKLMAEAGYPTHSFNLGVNAMRSPEDNFVLETVLKKRKKPLKYVFVESNPIRLDSANDRDPDTLRKSYWMDSKRFQAIIRRLLEIGPKTNSGNDSKWGMMAYSSRKFINRELNLGRGLEWVEARFEKPPKSLKKIYGTNWQGWDLKRKQPPIKPVDWKIIQERLADLEKNSSVADYGSPQDQQQLKDKRQMIEAHGAKMIVFTPPLAYSQLTPDPKITGELPVLAFWDPSWYPEFYERKNLADAGHFNAVGAELFTRAFVAQFLEKIRKGKME